MQTNEYAAKANRTWMTGPSGDRVHIAGEKTQNSRKHGLVILDEPSQSAVEPE
jgi:hypothetical protein